MQTVSFRAGDPIISEGDSGDTAFFIVAGSVEVVLGQGDKARSVGTLGEGEVFGEMCLIEAAVGDRDRADRHRMPRDDL